MHFNTILPGLVLAAAVSALTPPPLYRQIVHTVDTKYFQGSTTEPGSCDDVAITAGHITSDVCHTIDTSALSVAPLSNRNCEYVLYQGSSDCDSAEATRSTTFLAAGGEPVCIKTGVLDGGDSQPASAILKCGPIVSSSLRPSRIRRALAARAAAPSSSSTVTSSVDRVLAARRAAATSTTTATVI